MKSLIFLCLLLAVFAVDSSPLKELESRITNGTFATRGRFPFQVGLELYRGHRIYWCGGTIISDRWILTAAHCISGVDGATVFLGALNISNFNEKGQHRIYSSKANMVIHANYQSSTFQNDIALIKLPLPIEFNEIIQPAQLPKLSKAYSSYEGELVVASGWGSASDKNPFIVDTLRFIEVPVAKQFECNLYYNGDITDGMICIETPESKSACRGDSGGPLVYKDGDQNIVIGASSFGKFYCERGIPSVYTRVTAYLDWIEEFSGVVNK